MEGNGRRLLKWKRYELKYLITEAQAAEVRRCCRAHLPTDPYAQRQAGFQYPILSVYLDSPTRELLRMTVERQVQRFKLRVRTYRGYRKSASGLPAFFEIKRKSHGIVHKTRARVSPELADTLLWNQRAFLERRTECDAPTYENVNEFLQLRSRLQANPVVGVYYAREAYEGNSMNRLRVTLDRNLHYGVQSAPGNGHADMWWQANPGGVILEIKFTGTYPFWVTDMLHRVEVLRRGECKYAICSRAASAYARRGFA